MPIDRAAIRARVRKAIEADLAKGDTPGHDFHGNQYTSNASGGEITRETVPISRITINHNSHERTLADIKRGAGSKTKGAIKLFHNTSTGQLLVDDGSHRIAEAMLAGKTSIKAVVKHADYSDTVASVREEDRLPGHDATKHARPDHHVDQSRSPRGTFGGHIPTVQSDDANSFIGTPNPDSATDMESSYGYHGPAASPEEATAEVILTEVGTDGMTGELQGDFESGQQGIPQPTLWGLLSLSNRRTVKPVDGQPNIFDDVTRYINTVQGQPDTVLIDPGVTPAEQR